MFEPERDERYHERGARISTCARWWLKAHTSTTSAIATISPNPKSCEAGATSHGRLAVRNKRRANGAEGITS
jgi:hypothetical protein